MSVGFWVVVTEGREGAGAFAGRIISFPRKSDGSSISGSLSLSLSDTSSIRGLDMMVFSVPLVGTESIGRFWHSLFYAHSLRVAFASAVTLYNLH